MRRKIDWLPGLTSLVCLVLVSIILTTRPVQATLLEHNQLDQELTAVLREAGFTGRIEASLESRLGRKINPKLADIGRLLWFDTITGLNDDNTCAGCHSPTAG